MKKKIAIVFNRMIVGGAERSLLEFLRRIDQQKYEVTLFTRNDQGAFFNQIPAGIQVLFTECANPSAVLWDDLKHLRLFRVAKGITARLLIKVCKNDYWQFALSMMTYQKLPGRFDCAIAYKLGCEDTATVLTRINARKRCGFVHHVVEAGCDGGVFRHMRRIGRIFCVSSYAKQCLERLYPTLTEKTEVLHNLVDVQSIRMLAQQPTEQELQKTAMVTVGRLEREKGQDMVPQTVRLLLDRGRTVYWYLVGDGSMRETIENEIKARNVEDHVFLLGTKQNPYPYMNDCDIYVQTSRTEGWCLTTQEAKILLKPVVTTDLPVMYEQFCDQINGSITKGVSPEALAQEIDVLLNRQDLQERYIRNLQEYSDDGTKELEKLYDFIEN
jgi:glycosyltransferase involved in cell wall biosynthesis